MPLYVLSWTIGTIIGPMLGGTFSNPADKFPLLDVPLLRQYPYAMPCMISAGLSMFGATLAYFLMEEVRRFRPQFSVACLTHEHITIDSSIKESTSGRATQAGKVLRIGARYPSCCSVICSAAICHSVPAIIDHLWLRSGFCFRRF
jgi:hypothetical protein